METPGYFLEIVHNESPSRTVCTLTPFEATVPVEVDAFFAAEVLLLFDPAAI